jgi:hypothetical protein
VTNQTGAAPEQKTFIPAFADTKSSPAISPPRHRLHKTGGLCGRRPKMPGTKPVDRRAPFNQHEVGGADPANSSHKSDLAFQHAMRCAAARGLERPPRIGVIKDLRPLTAPRLFEPVPHASGCTSPALECAELAARND